ncbi:putative leucine-rich repeat-containing protein DDB_G0290503 isoform X2 [Maniola hyperantus]
MQENLVQANKTLDSQSSDSESESSQSQPESQVQYPVQTKPKKIKTKKNKTVTTKKKTKSEKFLMNQHKIIESISPVLLRKTLQHILDFLLKKEEASIIFSDLAPVEAKFLENFLGIYNKRVFFRDILSPACNDLLDKMCEFFKEFDKACKLEVYAAKYNVHNRKREVTFMKVPRYTRTNAGDSQTKIVTPEVKAEKIQSVAPFRKGYIPKPILSQTIVNSNSNITIPNEKPDAIEYREIKLSMNAENGEGASSINARSREGKVSMFKEYIPKPILSQTIVNSNSNITIPNEKPDAIEYRKNKLSMNAENGEGASSINARSREGKVSMFKEYIPKPILSQTIVNSNSNITIPNERGDAIEYREMKLSMNAEKGNARNREGKVSIFERNVKDQLLSTNSDTEDNKCTKSLLITDKLVVLNKDLLKHEIGEIALARNAAKTIPPTVNKIDKPIISKIRARSVGPRDRSLGPTDRSLGPRKDRLLIAMSTPLESDKAMRMMRLMGWQGGALGLRGDGIVEPIIPALDLVPGKGFGHVKEKPKSTKSVKKSKVEKKPKPVKTSQTEDTLKPVKTSQTEERLKPVETSQTEERLKSVKTSQLEQRLKPVKTSQIEDEPPKPVKNLQMKEEPPVKLSRRVLDRIEFLYKILDLITKDRARREKVVTYPVQLCKKQKMCYDNIIRVLNKRKHTGISLTDHENDILSDIASVMDTEPHLTLDMMVTADWKELTIKKTIDFVINTADRMRWPTLLSEMQDLQENINLEKKMSKSEFEIYICSTVLEFLKSDDNERLIDFDATLTEKCRDVVETICSCVNNKVKIPYKPVKELSDKILEVNNTCFLDVQFYAKPTRSILLRKFNHRKPAINTEVLKNIIKRYVDTTIPGTENVNNHRKSETVKTNNDKEANKENTEVDMITNKATASNIHQLYADTICERLNLKNYISKPESTVSHPFIDAIHNSAVDDEEIKENMQKRNEYNDNLKLHNFTINSSENVMGKTSGKFKRFPLYVKDMNVADNLDFRRIDMDLIQVTINLLTSNNKHAEDITKESQDNDIVTNDHENNDFNINNNSKYAESSKLNDKLDVPCEVTDNMRKWYDHSEKFLICDKLVENKDSNNNKNQVTNLELNKHIGEKVIHDININTITDKAKNCYKTDTNDTKVAENIDRKVDDAIEADILNQDIEKQIERNVSQDLKPIGEYEGCDGIKDSIDIESKELHQAGEDLKTTSVPDVCSDNQNGDDVIVSEESHQEVKNHSITKIIQLESNSIYKQDFEIFNDKKTTIDDTIETKTHSKLDIIPIDGDNIEDFNAMSVNEVLTYNIKDSVDVIESKESHPVDEKNSEIDIVQTHNIELSDYDSEESLDTDNVLQVIIQNKDCLTDYDTENSSDSLHTDEENSKLDIINVESNHKEDDSPFTSKNGPKESQHNNNEIHSKKSDEIEENNIKDLKLTIEFETDDTKKSSEEGEIQTKLKMSNIETDYNKKLIRKRKYEATESGESYEAVAVKHKFHTTSVNDDTTEDLRLEHRTVDLGELKKTEEINSKFDVIYTGKDNKENSTLKSECEVELPDKSHKIDEIDSELPEECHEIDKMDSKLDISHAGTDNKENLILKSEFQVELPEIFHKTDEINKIGRIQLGSDYKENVTLESEFDVELPEETQKMSETNSKLDIFKVREDYKENLTLKREFVLELPEESHKIDETNSKLDILRVGKDYEEIPTLESEFEIESLEESLKIDETNSKLDIDDDSKHAKETQIKDLNKTNTQIDKTRHDIVLIESNILEIEVIQKKIQITIENMDPENEFLPSLQYHGILNKGIVYSCHNKETSLWLRNILPDYTVIDYKSAINNHKLKIKITSFNKNAKKFLALLEVYNQGIKSENWKIDSEEHYDNSLILRVEMDSDSFKYVCDNNFSLFVGYDVAYFTIGC